MALSADPGRLLLRVLRASARDADCRVALTHAAETPWCSATFVGARHRVVAAGDGAAFARWLMSLPEADLPVRGHYVADCVVEHREGEAILTVLLLEA